MKDELSAIFAGNVNQQRLKEKKEEERNIKSAFK